MMRFVSVLFLVAPTSADNDCNRFCVAQLGSSACIKGSYTKDNGFCQGLFWTSASRDSICVFGTPGCSDNLPVTAVEAADRMNPTTSTSIPETTTESTMAPAVEEATSSAVEITESPDVGASTTALPTEQSRRRILLGSPRTMFPAGMYCFESLPTRPAGCTSGSCSSNHASADEHGEADHHSSCDESDHDHETHSHSSHEHDDDGSSEHDDSEDEDGVEQEAGIDTDFGLQLDEIYTTVETLGNLSDLLGSF